MKKLIFLVSLLTITNSKIIGYCDIKGNVINPGVYEINEKDTINDIIKKAGGLKKESYTDNINLSKLVNDEMVIYIHNKSEIEKAKELSNCDCSPIIKYKECEKDNSTTIITTTTTKPLISEEIKTTKNITTSTKEIVKKKININSCDINDLISLNGLGENKAKKIIEYRNINGNFNSIEDLLKVDGIGNKTFENIKEYIEI